MKNDLTRTNLLNDRPEHGPSDQEKARNLFEKSLHLDIFNVGSVLDSSDTE